MQRFLSLYILLLSTTICMAQNSLPIKKVSIFKNNTAMVIKEGSLPGRSGKVSLPVPSSLIFGSYFLGSDKDNPIKSMIVKSDTAKRKMNARSVLQSISGNVGKYATISYSLTDKIDKTISGKILSDNHGLVSIKEDNGKTALINAGNIYLSEFSDEINPTYAIDSITHSLQLTMQSAGEAIPFREIYMESNIGWLPSYFLIMKSDKSAHLEMKATIENFADALYDAPTELIVGAPQMTYSGKADPITYDYMTLDGTNPSPGPRRNGNVIAKSYAMAAAPAADFSSNYTTEGEKNDDTYIYKIGRVSLNKDAKGVYPIFAADIEYKDKYEGTISDIVNFFYNHNASSDETPIDVYHTLEIKNSTGVPLTTAPVTIINEKEQLMAQNQIQYTPAGSTCNIRLSKAVDIIMKNTEEEISRVDNAEKISKITYSSAKLKGNISLENYQEKEVTVSITKDLTGDVSSSSDGAKVIRPKGNPSLNPYTQIKWEVKLAANEKKSLTYEYGVYFTP